MYAYTVNNFGGRIGKNIYLKLLLLYFLSEKLTIIITEYSDFPQHLNVQYLYKVAASSQYVTTF